MTPPIRVAVITPAYQELVTGEHYRSMLQLVQASADVKDIMFLAFACKHYTPVAVARNEMFEFALNLSIATHALMMDADVGFSESAIPEIFEAFRQSAKRGYPFTAFPCRQRGGDWNYKRDGQRPPKDAKPTRGPCQMVGTALSILNLDTYRRTWQTAPWFRDDYETVNGRLYYVSEDFWHTRQLKERTGFYPYLMDTTAIHDPRGIGERTQG